MRRLGTGPTLYHLSLHTAEQAKEASRGDLSRPGSDLRHQVQTVLCVPVALPQTGQDCNFFFPGLAFCLYMRAYVTPGTECSSDNTDFCLRATLLFAYMRTSQQAQNATLLGFAANSSAACLFHICQCHCLLLHLMHDLMNNTRPFISVHVIAYICISCITS